MGVRLLTKKLLSRQCLGQQLPAVMYWHSGADNRLLITTSCLVSELAREVSYTGSGF